MTETRSTNSELHIEPGPGPCWADTSRDVFVLGAGFSIAANDRFPNTDDLGNRAIQRLREQSAVAEDDDRLPVKGFKFGQFEAWLAQLAEDQPYLSTAENLRNKALFVELSHSISQVLDECEEPVDHSVHPWLFDLVSVWHVRQAMVITLNYDTLIERNVANHLLTDPATNEQVSSRHILDDLPASPTEEGRLAGLGCGTLRLLKLHGSASWYWVPNDTTGATIGRLDPPRGTSRSEPVAEVERRRLLPGREPFIIPPISIKSGSYDNPVTREIWARAHEALRRADRVFFVGYSFPQNDLSVSGLIVNALTRRADPPEIRVVDREPKPVQGRLETIGVASIEEEPGGDAVRYFVKRYVDEAAKHVVERLRTWNPGSTNGSVCAAWGNVQDRNARGWIHEVRFDEPSRIVTLEAVGTHVRTSSSVPMLLDEMLGLLPGAVRIEIQHDGERLPVVTYRALPQRKGDGSIDSWQLELMPAGPPPRSWATHNPLSGRGWNPREAGG